MQYLTTARHYMLNYTVTTLYHSTALLSHSPHHKHTAARNFSLPVWFSTWPFPSKLYHYNTQPDITRLYRYATALNIALPVHYHTFHFTTTPLPDCSSHYQTFTKPNQAFHGYTLTWLLISSHHLCKAGQNPSPLYSTIAEQHKA